MPSNFSKNIHVAPLAGAWIEIPDQRRMILYHQSLPSRERGLKFNVTNRHINRKLVAPLAGAWIEIDETAERSEAIEVAPLAGAWIEIPSPGNCTHTAWSLPSRERGLKLHSISPYEKVLSSLPSRERGLKFFIYGTHTVSNSVAPLAGAWIEIMTAAAPDTLERSLPSRERGLKSL